MFVLLLAFAAFLALPLPTTSAQAPTPPVAPAFRGVLVEQSSDADAEAIATAFDVPTLTRGELRGLEPSWFAQRLRTAGLEAVDIAATATSWDPTDGPVDAALAFVAACASKKVRDPKRKKVDLERFETLCERAYRDVLGALGSGRAPESEAAQLHAALEHLRDVGPFGRESAWDDTTRELLVERLRRVAKVETDTLVRLARLVTAAAIDLGDPRIAKRARKADHGVALRGVRGDVFEDRESSFGRLVIGGFGDNEYDCSQIDVIIDFGGNDTYRGQAGGTGERSRFAVVVDLDGDDRYEALGSGLGSATYGIGILVDHAGRDVYRGGERCLGFGAAGVGVVVDLDGDDDYEVGGLGGGVGVARGVGVFIDRAGNDRVSAGAASLGCGLPGGLGVLVDAAGDDVRTLGERVLPLRGGAGDACSFGLGAGLGIGLELPGGTGICVDLAGADTYAAQGVALGAGVRGGVGLLRDVGAGDDVVRAGFATLGCAIQGGLGIAIDDGGADERTLGGFSAGCAIGGAELVGGGAWCVDRGEADDVWIAGASSFGVARRGAFGCCFDEGGSDRFERAAGVEAWPAIEGADRARTAVGLFVDAGEGAADLRAFEGVELDGAPVQVVETVREEGLERWIRVAR